MLRVRRARKIPLGKLFVIGLIAFLYVNVGQVVAVSLGKNASDTEAVRFVNSVLWFYAPTRDFVSAVQSVFSLPPFLLASLWPLVVVAAWLANAALLIYQGGVWLFNGELLKYFKII